MAYSDTGPVVGSHVLSVPAVTFAPSLHGAPQLPSGFPSVLDSPLAWTGGQFSRPCEYILKLSEQHVEEAERALEHFKGSAAPSPYQGKFHIL